LILNKTYNFCFINIWFNSLFWFQNDCTWLNVLHGFKCTALLIYSIYEELYFFCLSHKIILKKLFFGDLDLVLKIRMYHVECMIITNVFLKLSCVIPIGIVWLVPFLFVEC